MCRSFVAHRRVCSVPYTPFISEERVQIFFFFFVVVVDFCFSAVVVSSIFFKCSKFSTLNELLLFCSGSIV